MSRWAKGAAVVTAFVLGSSITATSATARGATRVLTITASSQDAVYGKGATPVVPSYDGLVGGDTAPAHPPTCTTPVTVLSSVGSYPSSCTGASDPDYTIEYVTGSVDVNAAPLRVTALSQTVGTGNAPRQGNPSYDGLVNRQTAPTTPPRCTTTASASSAPGTYVSSCSSASDRNYAIQYVDGVVTVVPAGTPILSIRASSQAQVYGRVRFVAVRPLYSGLLPGDTAPARPPTCVSTAPSSPNAGNYRTSCAGASDPDYAIQYLDGKNVVEPARLTYRIGSFVVRFGDPLPFPFQPRAVLDGRPVTVAVPPVCTTTATADSGRGRWPVNCSGGADPNYTFRYYTNGFVIRRGPQTIDVSTPPPTSARVGTTASIATRATSGLVTDIVAIPASRDVCTVSDHRDSTATVSYIGVGTCQVNVKQVGDNRYAQAQYLQLQTVVTNG